MRSAFFPRLSTDLRSKFVRGVVDRFTVPRDVVRFASKRYAQRTALIVGREHTTYEQLQDRYLRVSSAWRNAGIVKGSVVFCLVPDGREFIEIRLAGYETGVLLTQFHADDGMNRVLLAAASIKPQVFIYDPALAEECAQALLTLFPNLILWPIGAGLAYESALARSTPSPSLADIEPTHPVGVGFSSGTTGMPKALIVNHGSSLRACVSPSRTYVPS